MSFRQNHIKFSTFLYKEVANWRFLCNFAAVFFGAHDIFAQNLLPNLHLRQRINEQTLHFRSMRL